MTRELAQRLLAEEVAKLRSELGAGRFEAGRFADATRLLERVALGTDFPEFLTIPAYELID